MRGFEDSTNPVQLLLDPVVLTALGLPVGQSVSINGPATEATDYGILTNVNGTRYFVPWAKIYLIKQVQPVPPVGVDPVK